MQTHQEQQEKFKEKLKKMKFISFDGEENSEKIYELFEIEFVKRPSPVCDMSEYENMEKDGVPIWWFNGKSHPPLVLEKEKTGIYDHVRLQLRKMWNLRVSPIYKRFKTFRVSKLWKPG